MMAVHTSNVEARGCTVTDVSAERCGWDITSHLAALLKKAER